MDPEKVRNVVLVGHGDSGKTTLAEALLYVGGAITRQGTVEQGTTTFDYEPEETERGISLGLAVATFEWRGHRINLIDTPGSSDFVGEAYSALKAADLALFVVSGVDGVEVQTEQLWRVADTEGIPRAVIVTKLDRERASYERTIKQLRNSFGKAIAPIQVPIGSEGSLKGLVRVATERAYEYSGDKTGNEVDLPEEVEERVHTAHTALIETVVETDNGIRSDTSEEALAKLRPVFDRKHGSVTAGNASPLTDGGSAVLMMSEERAKADGLEPMGFVRSYAFSGLDPAGQLLQGPAYAAPMALDRAGITMADIGLMEMHEAFAAQVLSNLQALSSQKFAEEELGRSQAVGHPDVELINVMGGSLAIGHPFGATGARLTTTLLNEMRRRDVELGLITVCAAGGLGFAMVVERG